MKNRYSVQRSAPDKFYVKCDDRIIATCRDESDARHIEKMLNGYDDMKEASIFLFSQTSSMGRAEMYEGVQQQMQEEKAKSREHYVFTGNPPKPRKKSGLEKTFDDYQSGKLR